MSCPPSAKGPAEARGRAKVFGLWGRLSGGTRQRAGLGLRRLRSLSRPSSFASSDVIAPVTRRGQAKQAAISVWLEPPASSGLFGHVHGRFKKREFVSQRRSVPAPLPGTKLFGKSSFFWNLSIYTGSATAIYSGSSCWCLSSVSWRKRLKSKATGELSCLSRRSRVPPPALLRDVLRAASPGTASSAAAQGDIPRREPTVAGKVRGPSVDQQAASPPGKASPAAVRARGWSSLP